MAVEKGHLTVYVLLLKQDDPRKCTAARLAKFNLARTLFRIRQIPGNSIVLNPTAPRIILPGDRNRAAGIVAVDCSWEKGQAEFRKEFPGFQRRLPTLLAANPTNYAKKHKLSSAEALAAAAFILGSKELASRILSYFKWGKTFLTLNDELLEAYSTASSVEELSEIESQFF